jgi:glycosyltransferase involved in cell wall biosynthesis
MRMVRFLLFFLFLLGSSYLAGLIWNKRRSLEMTLLDQGFRPTSFSFGHHSFVCVIVAYQNGATIEKTLQSIFSQIYDSFRLIYVDDASADGSFEYAKELVMKSGQTDKVQWIRNEKRQGEVINVQQAQAECREGEILVFLKEGEFLAHEWVLSRLNQYYANPDLWTTQSRARMFPSYQLGNQLSLKTYRLGKNDCSEHEQYIPDILSLIQEKPGEET